ncbi:hypothetical protein SRABI06_03567 [Pseudomonas brassicacearum]|nr:hypothetical protein SRABI06_03567 [Pseudomonas brassicacearum]
MQGREEPLGKVEGRGNGLIVIQVLLDAAPIGYFMQKP